MTGREKDLVIQAGRKGADMTSKVTLAGPGGEPLGIGGLVQTVFAIFRERFASLFAIGLVYSAASLIVSLILLGPQATFHVERAHETAADGTITASSTEIAVTEMGGAGFGDFLDGALQILLYGLLIAAVVRLATDALAGRRGSVGDYLRGALPVMLTVAALVLVISVLGVIGLMAVVLPGLWIFAVFSVAPAAAVVEGAGFGALSRSAALTRGYRWPIAGFLLVMGLIVAVLTVIVALIVGVPGSMMVSSASGALTAIGVVVLLALSAFLGAAYAGLGALPAPVLYARLRQIKEGVAPEDLAG